MVKIQKLGGARPPKVPFIRFRFWKCLFRERNEAVSKLGVGMKELERLETERREMMTKIDSLTRDQSQRLIR